ncbi:MAG: nicotinamide riboside transporter PnuC [Pseudomonadales bacterium]|jgi:nicotinamide mononucleotide transporter|nr:nicotinamide riboside transporter PnuC [Pseudomonadales bacterium]MDP6826259.1 nicotinamide riboside transporter PnuC [Pseudomonadales bacterium]
MDIASFLSTLEDAARSMDWLSFVGLTSGLLCVWLLIRENIWTFPIGLLYAVVSVVVMLNARLYADTLLNVYYVVMNAYGWYFWLYRGERSTDDELLITHMPRHLTATIGSLVVLGTLVMGWWFDTRTDADLAYWDSATTTMSFAAMWMSARKYIENWVVWLVVDAIATVMYFYKNIPFYGLLYGIYLAMAFWGWRAWRKSMSPVSASA